MNKNRRLTAALSTTLVLAGSVFMAAPAATAASLSATKTVESNQRASLVAVPATNAELVDAWYLDFLGRGGDDGSRYWVDQLDAGAKPGDVLWAITHSPEFHQREINKYYRENLYRSPDAGAKYWFDGTIGNQFPDEWVLQNILASDEYSRDRVSDANVVRGWYSELLNRRRETVSDGEVALWAYDIREIGRLGALRRLYYQFDAINTRVDDHYRYLLRRPADGGGLSYWRDKEVESDINVAVLIASTDEYRSRVGADDNRN